MKKFLFFILFLIVLIVGSYYWVSSKMVFFSGEAEIFEGATVKEVAEILEKSEVIPNADVFYYYIRAKTYYHHNYKEEPEKFVISFKHGSYTFDGGSFNKLIQQLNNGSSDFGATNLITIPEGVHIEQIALIFEEKGMFTKEEFAASANDLEFYNQMRGKYSWLPEADKDLRYLFEGYLHPNTYDFPIRFTSKQVIEKLLDETDKLYLAMKSEVDSHALSFSEIISLASVVERESKFSQDRPKVAQVFLNRLEKGMKLESDITAAYANNEHKVFMTYDDIETKSLYNTYFTAGLPVGPICSPSLESIQAVIKPTGKDFKELYFYARPSGETFYAKTWEEHDRNRQKYEHEWLELTK